MKFTRVGSACQTLLVNSSNLTIVNNHYYASRIPSKVVILTGNSTIYQIPNKMPYDLEYISNGKVAVKYSAVEDQRWRQINVAYMLFPPFLFEDAQGNLRGSTFDIWKVLEAKLALKLDYRHKHVTYADNYKKLAPGLVDLALPQDSQWITRLEVK